MLLHVCAFLLLAVEVSENEAAIDKDQVKALPGLTFTPSFRHYSGYLKATGTRKLHYWFVESQRSPSSDPLVLWLNGGPGCSSLDGLLSEHGPFRVAPDGKTLVENKHSWNRVANMVYLEAPAGVGYSYSDDKNYTYTDDDVSMDNYLALKYFLQGFHEFASNEVYVTGESYGGVYVPTLSVRLIQDKTFNFKGFAVGNGLSSYKFNSDSLIFFGNYHGVFGQRLWKSLTSSCCPSNSMDDKACNFSHSSIPECQHAYEEAESLLNVLNMYNIYQECHTDGSLIAGAANSTWLNPIDMLSNSPSAHHRLNKLQSMGTARVKVVPPCINVSAITTWLNRAAVRQALHIPPSLPGWEICSGEVAMRYVKTYMDMTDVYIPLLNTRKYRILVYNGDIDMACNFLGDEWFVDSLKQEVVSYWHPWYYKSLWDGSNQVAGFLKQYTNISFVTVKGAGHMVPSDKPGPALEMFMRFLNAEI